MVDVFLRAGCWRRLTISPPVEEITANIAIYHLDSPPRHYWRVLAREDVATSSSTGVLKYNYRALRGLVCV